MEDLPLGGSFEFGRLLLFGRFSVGRRRRGERREGGGIRGEGGSLDGEKGEKEGEDGELL